MLQNRAARTRRRVVVSQSKNGCFTCKSRRVKCDEEKPTCRRCCRSNRECEGYPERAYQSNGTSLSVLPSSSTPDRQAGYLPATQCRQSFDALSRTNGDPQYALVAGFRRSLTQERLSRLGCSLLRDGLEKTFYFDSVILNDLVPKMIFTLPSVNAAAAALGAYYELQTSPSPDNNNERLAAAHYALAVRLTREDLLTQSQGSTPLLAGCMLLAFVELLLRRRQYALLHLRGAYKILGIRSREKSTESLLTADCDTRASSKGKDDLDELTLLFRSFDLQTATYSDGTRPPDTEPSHIDILGHYSMAAAEDIHSLDAQVISAIHSCYYFISLASSYTGLPASLIPNNLTIEQGRHIATLKFLLKTVDLSFSALEGISPGTEGNRRQVLKNYIHKLMLRNLCMSAIIYISTILNPYETSWDAFADDFRQIITNAEAILDRRDDLQKQSPTPPKRASFKFIPSLGRAGREGPWVGDLLAAVTERAVEVEEKGVIGNFGSKGADEVDGCSASQETVLSVIVPERSRIRLVRMAENNGSLNGNLWLTASSGVTKVRYTRCRDVVKMLATAATTPTTGPKRESVYDMEACKQYWEVWSDILQFESGKPFKLIWSEGEI
ncbi:hypothetical protein FQN54_006561 [Arachnomyces sp. PD_36]|nr:hypothetical protein FQN54_006561 [Arachnomyces sp. PD_36]